MNEVNAESGTIKACFLVRDADGNPQFDDWENIPEAFHPVLTDKDWLYIKDRRET